MSGDAPQKLGKFTLIRKLAQGGMAEIFLANQEGPSGFQKQLVIKRILPHLADDTKFVEMFLDEARIAAQFNNPNIVQIYDLGEVEGAYFIAMEYIDGYDLSQIIERASQFGKRVPSQIAARIIADSLGGLHYAHSFKDPGTGEALRLVHRDISPQNLLVNKDGVVKLVDFGVAKAKTSSSKTQTGAVKGKFSYMAPEQIAGEELDGRCDIFAMGIVLYELLLGVRPFGEHSDLMAITAIVHQAPKNPREIDESFPVELEQILNRSLAKARAERYATALDMQRDLEMFIQHSGAFITAREVATYLEGLFSDEPPDLDAIGLGASSTHSYSVEELRRSAENAAGTMPASTAVAIPSARRSTPQMGQTTPPPSLDDIDVEKKSNGALMGVIILLVLAVLGGAGFLAYMMLGSDNEAASEGSAEAATGTDEDEAPVTDKGEPPATDKGEPPVTDKGEPPPDGADTHANATGTPPDGEEPVEQGDPAGTDGSGTDTVEAADTTPPPDGGKPADDAVEGEPVKAVIVKADISHIEPEKLPGVKTNLAAGFGEVRLKSNLKAKVQFDGRTVAGKLPATLSLKAGEYELTFVSRDKNFSATKTVEVTVFDGRHYELEVPFEKGKLSLKTEPAEGFEVHIDGKKVGKTPLEPVELFEGQHTVELDVGGKRKKFSLTVLPGDNERTIRVR